MYKKFLLATLLTLSSVLSFASTNVEEKYKELKSATQEKIEVIENKLEKIGERISYLSGEAKVEMKKNYKKMIKMKDSLENQLADAGDSTADTWAKTKDKVEDYADDLESRLDKAIN